MFSVLMSFSYELAVPAYTDSLVGEGTCIINVEPSDSSKQNGIQQILVSTQLQNSG